MRIPKFTAQHIEITAAIAHGANRSYCKMIGDPSQPEWADAPEWQKESARNGVRLHFATMLNGRHPCAEQSHVAWMEQKRLEGWVYGPTKNPDKKQHPCMVEHSALPKEQQAKDVIFVGVCVAMFDSIRHGLI